MAKIIAIRGQSPPTPPERLNAGSRSWYRLGRIVVDDHSGGKPGLDDQKRPKKSRSGGKAPRHPPINRPDRPNVTQSRPDALDRERRPIDRPQTPDATPDARARRPSQAPAPGRGNAGDAPSLTPSGETRGDGRRDTERPPPLAPRTAFAGDAPSLTLPGETREDGRRDTGRPPPLAPRTAFAGVAPRLSPTCARCPPPATVVNSGPRRRECW